MHEQMPEKMWDWLGAESLRIARLQLGCGELTSVRIGPLKPQGSGPNWEVLGFKPDDIGEDAKANALRVDRGVVRPVRSRKAQGITRGRSRR
jgi:hypothetical protein